MNSQTESVNMARKSLYISLVRPPVKGSFRIKDLYREYSGIQRNLKGVYRFNFHDSSSLLTDLLNFMNFV
jgi:hypothetical protein